MKTAYSVLIIALMSIVFISAYIEQASPVEEKPPFEEEITPPPELKELIDQYWSLLNEKKVLGLDTSEAERYNQMAVEAGRKREREKERKYLERAIEALKALELEIMKKVPEKPTIAISPAGHFGINALEGHIYRRYISPKMPGTPLEEVKVYFQWEVPLIAQAGISWHRTLTPAMGVFMWNRIVRHGSYDYSIPDTLVRAIQPYNISILALVYPEGIFEPGKPPSYRIPEETAWKAFLTTLVERYDGDGVDDMPGLLYGIKYWEIGNEPNIMGPDFNTGVKYVRFLKMSYEAVKAADPQAKVLNGGAVPIYNPVTSVLATRIVKYWDSFFRIGGAAYIDILNIHYTTPEPAPHLKKFLEQWNSLLTKHKISKDIWITETGTYSGSLERWGKRFPPQSEEAQANWWVKHAVYGLAHGVKKLFWTLFYIDQAGDWRENAAFIKAHKTRKVLFTIQQILTTKIDRFTSAEQLTDSRYKFMVDSRPVYVLWGTGALPAEITGTVKVTDIRGEEQTMDASAVRLTEVPIFVETP